jgi:hypothetical protein
MCCVLGFQGHSSCLVSSTSAEWLLLEGCYWKPPATNHELCHYVDDVSGIVVARGLPFEVTHVAGLKS